MTVKEAANTYAKIYFGDAHDKPLGEPSVDAVAFWRDPNELPATVVERLTVRAMNSLGGVDASFGLSHVAYAARHNEVVQKLMAAVAAACLHVEAFDDDADKQREVDFAGPA